VKTFAKRYKKPNVSNMMKNIFSRALIIIRDQTYIKYIDFTIGSMVAFNCMAA